MATTQTLQATATRKAGHPPDSWIFDLAVALSILGYVFGLYLDGWAHAHGKVDTSFFTPWHGILYGMYATVGAILVGTHFRNVLQGYAWTKALPKGYLPGFIGVLIFAFGGVGDMFWHEIFGIEEGIEALYSPSHLTLAIGGFLVMSSPFVAAWGQRKKVSGLRDFLPILFSALAMLSVFTFFTQFTYFGSGDIMRSLMGARPYSREYSISQLAVSSFLISTALYSGLVLLMLRRWRLPFGAITILFAANNALMVWLYVENNIEFVWVLAFALSGLLVDILIHWLKPSVDNLSAVRVTAAIFPFVTTLLSLGIVHWMGLSRNGLGLWWEIHMWLGAPLLAAFVGLLLSYLAFPPPIPTYNEV